MLTNVYVVFGGVALSHICANADDSEDKKVTG